MQDSINSNPRTCPTETGQKGQKFKAILNSTMGSRLEWTTSKPDLKLTNKPLEAETAQWLRGLALLL